jgi:hypothetical protein
MTVADSGLSAAWSCVTRRSYGRGHGQFEGDSHGRCTIRPLTPAGRILLRFRCHVRGGQDYPPHRPMRRVNR